jgi:signal transduction histidine kinase
MIGGDASRECAEGLVAGLAAEIDRLEEDFSQLGADGPQRLDAAEAAARAAGDGALLGRVLCLAARAHVFRGRIRQGIETADEALRWLTALDDRAVSNAAGVIAEAWRCSGRGCFKLGLLAEALKRLETAVSVAEAGLSRPATSSSPITAATAYLRALVDLGVAFTVVRESEEAIEAYAKAVATADAHPEIYRLIPDDVLLALSLWAEALQRRHRRGLCEGLAGQDDLAAADRLLEGRAKTLIDGADRHAAEGARPISGYGFQSYWGAMGHQALLAGRADLAFDRFARQHAYGSAVGNAAVCGRADTGMARALLARGDPAAALIHLDRALAQLDTDDDAFERAEALSAMAEAQRRLGHDQAALDCLEAQSRLRDRLHAIDAQRFAGYLAARIGLERVRAEAEAQRRIAADLTQLNAQLESQAVALTQQAMDLRAARQSAEAASRAKSEFLATMSHELRTPLNAILGFAELMRDQLAGPPQPSWIGYAAHIHQAGAHLLAIINDLLDLARIEAQRAELDVTVINLGRLFDDCLTFVEASARAAGLDLAVDPGLPTAAVRGDMLRLRQILINLLSNAIKFTPRGGTVRFGACCLEPGVVTLYVTDTGQGMTEADIAIALEPFGQVRHMVGPEHHGTGLGLPLAAKLAELHGGSLSISSRPGIGTTVEVRLPACHAAPDAA